MSTSPIDALPRMRRVSPSKAVGIVEDFRNYPPPDAEDGNTASASEIFPPQSIAKGPAAILPVFEVLIEQTTERGHRYTPYFTGSTKKQISKSFALGLVNIAKYQPYFAIWHPDPRYPPSPRLLELKNRFDTPENASLRDLMAGSKIEIEMKCTLEDRNVPIPFWQNYNCQLLFLFKAALRTKPELLKTLTKAGAFQAIVDLVRNEVEVPPSDLLQQVFCEFVGEFQEEKVIMKKLHEADVLRVLLSFATSPSQKVRQFSASLIDSVQSLTKAKTTAKNIKSDSVQGVVDTLMTCDKNDLTQQTLCSLINDMITAEEDAKDQLCQPRNMVRMLKLIEETTESREVLACQDESQEVVKVMSGHSVPFWNAKALIHAVCNALGGSAERQKLVATTCGKRLLTRYVILLDWFSDASPADGFGDMNSVLCDSFYKMIARTTEGRLVVNEVEAPLPLLRWANKVLRLVVPGSDCLPRAQVESLLSGPGQRVTTALEAAKAGVVAYGEFISLRDVSVADISPDIEELVYENFQLAIDLLSSPQQSSLLSFESVCVIAYLIHATIFSFQITPPLSFVKRAIHYLQVRTTNGYDLPYLTVLSDIESRNTKLSFQHQEFMMKEVDNIIVSHHNALRKFTEVYSPLRRELDADERDTFEWVGHKVTAGAMLNRLVASLGVEDANSLSQEEPTKIEVCNAIGCANCENLKGCSACQQVAYCGKECQMKDWPRHKAACKKARKTAKAKK